MRAAVYTRQSRDRDGNTLAVTRQREDCRRLAAERGWTVVAEFEDNDTSASTGKARPGYLAMLAAVEARHVDVIVAWHVDRVVRRLDDLGPLINLCERQGVRIALVTGDLDLSNDAGRLVGRILASVAQGEVERKSARQKRAALQAAEAGKPRGGPRPFGYAVGGAELDPLEAPALVDAYRLALGGATLASIARALNDRGLATPQGKAWRHGSVRHVLLNPRNIAHRAYRGEVIGPAAWPAVVDEDTWRAVSTMLTRPERRRQTGTTRRWLLSGIALCGVCGDGTTVRVSYRERDAAGQPVRIYRCRDHAHLGRAATLVEEVVERVIVARLSRDDARDLLVDDDRPDVDALREEADGVRRRLDEVAAAFAEGDVTAAQLKTATARLRARLADVEGRMAHVDRAPVLAELVTADDVAATWAALPLARRRAVVDLLAVVTLLPGRGGRAPFDPASVRVERRLP